MKKKMKSLVLLVGLSLVLSVFSQVVSLTSGGPILDHESDEYILDTPVFPGHDPQIQMMIDQVEESNIYDYIDTLQSFEDENGVPTRLTGTSGFDDAALWAYQELSSFGLDTYMQNFTSGGHSSTNVIAVHPGTNPDLEPQTYIIGGHLDSINNWGGAAPGADDNGSGSAVTIEAARIMSQYSFERTIRFALWGAEEQGLHGSSYYASNIDETEEQLLGKLNYDMVGYAEPDLAITLHANTPSNWMLDYKADVSEAYDNIGINFTYEYDSTEWRSDHSSFWDEGYNATLSIETVFSPYYHTADDTLDKLTLPQITHTTRHAIASLGHLAQPVAEGDPPSITVTSPIGGEEWYAFEEEDITWTTEKGEDPIDGIEIWYSTDTGDSWYNIDSDIQDTGSYTWGVPNEDSLECKIRVRVVDSLGRWNEDISGVFAIHGIPPSAPSNLIVDHIGQATQVIFEDDVESGDLGYTTGQTDGASEWSIRTHGSAVGDYSWDFGDGNYNDPSNGGLSWLITPEIDLTDATEIEMTFMHWREFEDDGSIWDGGNLKISTDGPEGSWDLITDPTPAYDGTVEGGWDNPLEGEPAWGHSTDWEEVTVDLSGYEGESVWIRWDAGVDNYGSTHAGWRIDDILVTGEVSGDGDDHNLLTWDASPDDPDEVSHYNIYRSDEHTGPWDDSTLIDSLPADGSADYSYIDIGKGTADDVWWCYVVRAVGVNGLEEQNTDVGEETGYIGAFDIPLYADGDADGWNFVSYNLFPLYGDTSITAILNDPNTGIQGRYDQVMYYDAESHEWFSYVPGRDEHYNNLQDWDHTMGIWIRMTSDDTLTIEGYLLSSTDIVLHPGWNMVGMPSSTSGNHNLPGEVSCIGYFDDFVEYNLAYDHDPSNFEFSPGEGYWLYNDADQSVEWIIDY